MRLTDPRVWAEENPPPVPVMPGPEGEQAAVAGIGPCQACGSRERPRRLRWPDGDTLFPLCADFAACCRAYRNGASPESYAAGLRGEILGVAP